MLNVASPRIHNLGDFLHCLPTLSGLYKKTNQKMNFIICDRLQRFVGIKELLMAQGMFSNVSFVNELTGPIECLLIDDTGPELNYGRSPITNHRFWNFTKQSTGLDFEIDDDFELQVDEVPVQDVRDKIIVGDRWSPSSAPDVDTRRYSNLIENAGVVPANKAFYLDYTKDLMYNANIIKFNRNPFVTTFTGIGILADLMKKDLYVLWDEDMRNWQGKPVEYDFDLHYYKDRGAKLVYIKDFKI